MNLLDLLDGCESLPARRPAIIGSDLLAYAAAAKLRAAGSEQPILCDFVRRPAAGILERLYFRRWARPNWHAAADCVSVIGNTRICGFQTGDNFIQCDGIVFSGELVPNSELIAAAGLAVTQPDRRPERRGSNELSERGWFIAGAARGGLHSADWCYGDGLRAAKAVAKHLAMRSSSPI
jgi:hypothetical protein